MTELPWGIRTPDLDVRAAKAQLDADITGWKVKKRLVEYPLCDAAARNLTARHVNGEDASDALVEADGWKDGGQKLLRWARMQ